MNKDEALRLAHEGVEIHSPNDPEYKVCAALIAALEAKDEPLAGQPLPCPFCGHVGLNFADGETYRWGVASCGGCGASCGDIRREYPDLGEWHTEAIAEWNRRSPAPQRKPLTDEQAMDAYFETPPFGTYKEAFIAGIRFIEAAHGIKVETK